MVLGEEVNNRMNDGVSNDRVRSYECSHESVAIAGTERERVYGGRSNDRPYDHERP